MARDISFVVLRPGNATGAEGENRTVFLPERFIWTAAIVPVVYFAVHRAWLAAFVSLVLPIVAGVLGAVLGIVPWAVTGANLVLAVFFGLEASNLRRIALIRRGYQEVATVVAADRTAAERRYFSALPADDTVRSGPTSPMPAHEVFGLFPQPGGRGAA